MKVRHTEKSVFFFCGTMVAHVFVGVSTNTIEFGVFLFIFRCWFPSFAERVAAESEDIRCWCWCFV